MSGAVTYYKSGAEAEDAMAVLAKWISRNRNIKVVYHNGSAVDADVEQGIIRIPRMACASGVTEDALMMLRGRVYHEAGHVDESRDVAKKEYPMLPDGTKGAKFQCWNALEDRRMETAEAEKHPGAKVVFRWNNDYYNREIAGKVSSGQIDAPVWEAVVAMSFMSQGSVPMWRPTRKAQTYIDAAYSTFLKVRTCQNARDTLDLAEEVYQLLKQANKDFKEEKPPQDDSSGGQEGPKGESQEGGGEGQDGEPQSDSGPRDIDDEEKPRQVKKSGKGKKDDGEKDDENASDGKDDNKSDEDGDEDGDGKSGDEEKPGDKDGDDEDGDGDEEDGDGKSGDEDGDEEDGDGDEDSGKPDGDEDGAGKDDQGEDGDGQNDEGSGDDSNGSDEDGKDEEDSGVDSDHDGDNGGDKPGEESDDPDGSAKGKPGDSEYQPDDSGDEGGKKDGRDIEDEVDGVSQEEVIHEKLDGLFKDLDPADLEYLSRRDLDVHGCPNCGDDERVEFKQERESISVVVASMTQALEQALRSLSRCRRKPYLRQGRIDRKRLVAISKGLSKEVFYRKQDGMDLDVAVAITIDESASMNTYLQVRLLAIAIGEALNAIGVPFEIIGSTTVYPGNSPLMPLLEGFTRTNPIVYSHYKNFSEAWQVVRPRIVNTGAHMHNVDGEVVEYAAFRLAQRKERRKVVFSLSDGEPCAGHSNDTMMAKNLVRVCKRARKDGIEVYGFGLGTEKPKQFYGSRWFVYLEKSDEMGPAFVKKFADVVTGGRVRV